MPARRVSFLYTSVHRDLSSVPLDVRRLSFAMFVYMLAWGIFDPFLSIFIYNTTQSYSVSGLLYGLFFLIGVVFALPVGDLVGKVNKIKFIGACMAVYPLIGVLYFSAAIFMGVAAMLVLFIARVLHGFATLLWIAVDDFIREKSPKGKTSALFGLQMTFNRLAYVLAPAFVIAAVLLSGLDIGGVHWLALAIVPLSLVSLALLSRIKDDGEGIGQGLTEVILKDKVFKNELDDLKGLGLMGYFTLLIGFFMAAVDAIMLFLIPLYALTLNLGLLELSLLFAIISTPYLFSFVLAQTADKFGKPKLISFGFLFVSMVLAGIYLFASDPISFFIACFALGLILAMLQPAVNGLVTDITPRVKDGEMTGIFSAVVKVSGFLTAVALGVLSDAFSLRFPFLLFAVLLFGMAALTYLIKGKVVVRI